MKALIIVDMQNDFVPGGALEVPEGNAILPVINGIQPSFDLVVATQDWHPPGHKSFASNHEDRNVFDTIQWHGLDQVLWPDHCIQGTPGAAFHSELDMKAVEAIFRKGMDADIDSYSGFYDNGHRKSTGLAGYLRDKGAEDLYFCGLAADVCVYYTLMDALKEGFRATLLVDATRALDAEAFSGQQDELRARGGHIRRTQDVD